MLGACQEKFAINEKNTLDKIQTACSTPNFAAA
jgi:hypothetical protein